MTSRPRAPALARRRARMLDTAGGVPREARVPYVQVLHRRIRAHRVAWMASRHCAIPEGMVVRIFAITLVHQSRAPSRAHAPTTQPTCLPAAAPHTGRTVPWAYRVAGDARSSRPHRSLPSGQGVAAVTRWRLSSASALSRSGGSGMEHGVHICRQRFGQRRCVGPVTLRNASG